MLVCMDTLLSRRQVETVVGLRGSYIYELIQRDAFPKPVRVGRAAVRWRSSEIVEWIESRPRAGSSREGT